MRRAVYNTMSNQVGATAPNVVLAGRGKRSCAKYCRRRMRGRGIMDFLRKAHSFVRKNKVISRGANALSYVLPGKYRKVAEKVGGIAGTLGYGRRSRGSGLRLAGQGITLAGGMRCRC